MKVYISVDIEGVAGIVHWDEATEGHAAYQEFRELMTGEAVAAINGAKAAGATEILVKDAHNSGRNLILERLPEDVTIIRGWAGHPLCMLQELDASFAAVVMIGYHAAGGSEANPLAHTLSDKAKLIRLNGQVMSEFSIHAYAAATLGVPVAFLSGDQGICDEVKAFDSAIRTAAVKRGHGSSTISVTPVRARAMIHDGVAEALAKKLPKPPKLAKRFELQLTYGDPVTATRMAYYPGARHIGNRTISFETADYFEVLRMLNFVT